MTKQPTPAVELAAESQPAAAEPGHISKSEFVQASREIKARADEARWLLRLSEILADTGELDVVYRQRKAAVEALEKRQIELTAALDEGENEAERIKAEAKRAAETLTAELGGKRADLEAELKRLQDKINERNAQFAEADRKLRDTRAQLTKLAKSLPATEDA
jgi:chromosome segregation ATPase